MGMSSHLLALFDRFHHLPLCFAKTDNKVDSDMKLFEDRHCHLDHIPVMIPTMRTAGILSSQSIEEIRCRRIDSDSYPVDSSLLHRFARLSLLQKNRSNKNTNREVCLLFEPSYN